ncbi:uncharacterized protein LOC124902071 isoform X2 [Homo sapiens]|uniref:uncharacterized protein LOC124902071 isoform X2 n=1 Tax=Homo sapiens TaxID=9606 RepID=UPI001FB1765C|nr:uncharacterized protein LOC124902071 isoform X2 [Homo sapiens]XP_047301282.1 uncharacterized protein LOC124902071 isoform X2 [Homo sapiens]
MLWCSTSNPSSGQVKGQPCSRAPCRIRKAARFGTPGVRGSSTSAVAVQAALPLWPQNPADVKALCLSVDFPSWRPHCCFKCGMAAPICCVHLHFIIYLCTSSGKHGNPQALLVGRQAGLAILEKNMAVYSVTFQSHSL